VDEQQRRRLRYARRHPHQDFVMFEEGGIHRVQTLGGDFMAGED
jgi:hypothetical protein